MEKIQYIFLSTFLSTLILNVFVCSSILLLHEMGHFLLGMLVGCKNIRLVLLDSELGTYTEMICPKQQPFYFSFLGAFLLVIPFSFSFLLLEKFLDKNLFFVGLGFNFLIAITDFPAVAALQILGFLIGFCMISYGEMVLIDKLLFFYKGE